MTKAIVRTLCALTTVTFLGCGGEEPAPVPAAPTVRVTDGTIQATGFTSDYFEFGLGWNAPWTGEPTNQMQEMMTSMAESMADAMGEMFQVEGAEQAMEEAQNSAQDSHLLLLLTDGPADMMQMMSPGNAQASLTIMANTVESMGVASAAQAIQQGLENQNAMPEGMSVKLVKPVHQVTVNGRAMQRADERITGPSGSTTYATLAYIDQGYVVAFVLAAPSSAKFAEVEAILNTITFYD